MSLRSARMDPKRISGCLFGMALGDALGAVTEFLSVEAILQQFPPDGPQAPVGNPAQVTDDTQMALAVGAALMAAPRPYAPDSLGQHLAAAFVKWYHDPKNTRAPGLTCMAACRDLAAELHWLDATRTSSKGCGANMRVMPVGVLPVQPETRAAIAQLQAALTHGHPTGLAAADLTAFIIADLADGGVADGLLARATVYALAQREVYYEAWLGDLWRRAAITSSAEAFIARGWDECLATLDRLATALATPDRRTDPCLQVGAGWVAEEALATALLCFLLFSDDPLATIRRAAVSSGDSDSIACIAGAFAGAHYGLDAWPTDWIERIEYRDQIAALSRALLA